VPLKEGKIEALLAWIEKQPDMKKALKQIAGAIKDGTGEPIETIASDDEVELGRQVDLLAVMAGMNREGRESDKQE